MLRTCIHLALSSINFYTVPYIFLKFNKGDCH
jgi:hypothetical protein